MNSNYIPFQLVLKNIISSSINQNLNHIYETIEKNKNEKNTGDLVSEKWDYHFINYLGQLSPNGSGTPPQLPPRNKI
ncbi:hypothetical protein [Spiroplasma endosymbiont of Tricholauxania praeusta]|uniref:hypothetical protein n=1 Tax=Spiroplasma endosymbiont of Tricholauxania praeusta TaxID=3066296 RepID=UPI0030CBFAB2